MPRNEKYVQSLSDRKIREFLRFPLEEESSGKLKTYKSSQNAIRMFLINFFQTPYGHRVMESNLGSNIHRFIGYPMNEEVKTAIQDTVEDEVTTNFPNLRLLDTTVEENESNGFTLNLKIRNRLKLRNDYLYDDEEFDLIDINIQIAQ